MTSPPTQETTHEAIQARHQAWLEEAGTMTMDLARKAHARAAAQLDDTEPAPPTAKDEATRFTALVRSLRQTVAAEARIAAGPAAPRLVRTAQDTQLLRSADPRLVLLRRTLHHAVRNDPDRAGIRRAVDADILDLVRTDPAATTPIQHTLVALTNKHAIHLDLAQVPDALLGNPDDDAEPEDPPARPATTDPPP